MREENSKKPSQQKRNPKAKSWFWPAIYGSIAILFIGMIWGINAFNKGGTLGTNTDGDDAKDPGLVIETNAPKESLKFPFKEELLESAVILQEFYDAEADESMREKALLVFNQTYVTNNGISVSIEGQPFEVVAAMSGVVEEVIFDNFQGDEIVLSHANGMKTIYKSVTGILVKKGDEVNQGEAIATASENEWNPTAGIHLLFEVIEDGDHINPRSLLAF